jgi:hypothetical protein
MAALVALASSGPGLGFVRNGRMDGQPITGTLPLLATWAVTASAIASSDGSRLAGSMNVQRAGDDGEGVVRDGLPGEEIAGGDDDGKYGSSEDEAAGFSHWLRCRDGGGVAALGVIDANCVGAARAGVVFGEALAEAAGFDADDGVEAGVVVVVAIEDLAAENIFFDLVGFTLQVGIDGELEKAAETVGVGETGTGQDFLQMLAKGGIAHCLQFGTDLCCSGGILR